MKIQPGEKAICGNWNVRGGKAEADDNCRRIDELLHNHLRKVGVDATGWDVLYQDPDDGRYWELIYPQSEMHGGGPPELREVGEIEVRMKYGAQARGV